VDAYSDYYESVMTLAYYHSTRFNGTPLNKTRGRFNPLLHMTREEFLTVALTGFNIPEQINDLSAFSDTANMSDWARKYFETAVHYGIISGNNGRLLARDKISIYEALIILRNIKDNFEGNYQHNPNDFETIESITVSELDSMLSREIGYEFEPASYIPDATPIQINSVTKSAYNTDNDCVMLTVNANVDTTNGASPYNWWRSNYGYFKASNTNTDFSQVCFYPPSDIPQDSYRITVKGGDNLGFIDSHEVVYTSSELGFTYESQHNVQDSDVSASFSAIFPTNLTAYNSHTIDLSSSSVNKTQVDLGIERIVVKLKYSDTNNNPVTQQLFSGQATDKLLNFLTPDIPEIYGQMVTLEVEVQTSKEKDILTSNQIRYLPQFTVSGKVYNADMTQAIQSVTIAGNQVYLDENNEFYIQLPYTSEQTGLTLSANGSSTSNSFENISFDLQYSNPRRYFVLIGQDLTLLPDTDSDNDSMPDVWENANGLNPNVNDANLDADNDGFSNIDEYNANTDPQDNQDKPVTPINGICGLSHNANFYTIPSTDLCAAGTAGQVTGTGPWNWSCNGIADGTDASCTANKITVNDASCGSSHGQTISSAPTTNLCSSGTASSVSGTGPWNWSCIASGGGSDANCSANKSTVINGACGSSDGQTLSSEPINNLCSSGTAMSITGSGPWEWSCNGTGGGTNDSCTASKAQLMTFYKPVIQKSINIPNTNCRNLNFSNYNLATPDITTNIYIAAGHGGLVKINENLDTLTTLESSWTCHAEIVNDHTDGGWKLYASKNLGFYNVLIGDDDSVYYKSWDNSDDNVEFFAREMRQVSGNTIAVIGQDGEVYLYENYSGKPVRLSSLTLNTNENLRHLLVVDNRYLYIATSDNDFFIVDTNNNTLNQINSFEFPATDTVDIKVHNGFMYVQSRNSGLAKYDISDVNAIMIDSEQFTYQDPDEFGQEMSLIDNKLFVSTNKTLYQFNYNVTSQQFDLANYGSFNDANLLNSLLAKNPANNKIYMFAGSQLSEVLLDNFAAGKVDGSCGTSHSQLLASEPTNNLCSSGTASSVSGTGPWFWSCTGTGGGSNTSCFANSQSNPPLEGEINTASITLDGNTSDWENVTSVKQDPQGDDSSSYTGDDFKSLAVAKDNNNLYLKAEFYNNANTSFGNSGSNPGRYHFSIDNFWFGIANSGGQWAVDANGAGSSSNTYLGAQYVAVANNIIEVKVPLSELGNATSFNEIKVVFEDCCAPNWQRYDTVILNPESDTKELSFSGQINFTNSSGSPISPPGNAKVHIRPSANNWDSEVVFVIPINSNGTFSKTVTVSSTLYSDDVSFPVTIFGDSNTNDNWDGDSGQLNHTGTLEDDIRYLDTTKTTATLSNAINVQVTIPVIVDLTPLTVTSGTPQTFIVSGINLPGSIAMSLAGSKANSCAAPFDVTTNSSKITCTPDITGNQRFYVGIQAGGEAIKGSLGLYVAVTSSDNVCLSTLLSFNNLTYTSNATIKSGISITTTGAVIVNNTAHVSYQAPNITLKPGFHAQAGSTFSARATAVYCPQADIMAEPVVGKYSAIPTYDSDINESVESHPVAQWLTQDDLPERLKQLLSDKEATASEIQSDANNEVILFSSDTDLLDTDTNALTDIYNYNTENETLTLISMTDNKTSGNGTSTQGRINGTGDYVIYRSEATDLKGNNNDTNYVADIYLQHIPSATQSRISYNSEGNQTIEPANNPNIAGDKPYLVYDKSDGMQQQIYSIDITDKQFKAQQLSQNYNHYGEHIDNTQPGISPNGYNFGLIARCPIVMIRLRILIGYKSIDLKISNECIT